MGKRGLVRCRQQYIKPTLGKTQVRQLPADRFGELRNQLAAFCGKLLAGTPHFALHFFQFVVQPCQLGVALLEALEFSTRFRAKTYDLRHGRAVFAFQRLNQVHALLQLLQARRIEFDFLRITRKRRPQIA